MKQPMKEPNSIVLTNRLQELIPEYNWKSEKPIQGIESFESGHVAISKGKYLGENFAQQLIIRKRVDCLNTTIRVKFTGGKIFLNETFELELLEKLEYDDIATIMEDKAKAKKQRVHTV